MIKITDQIRLAEEELAFTFVRADGPGGQNVNKVATAAELRFDVGHSPSLPEPVRQRLLALAGHRVSTDGILVISARRFRHQNRNREDAQERLVELIRRAAQPPKTRHATKPTRSSRLRRLESKRRLSAIKANRRASLAE